MASQDGSASSSLNRSATDLLADFGLLALGAFMEALSLPSGGSLFAGAVMDNLTNLTPVLINCRPNGAWRRE